MGKELQGHIAKEYWVPEDFVYEWASDCLLAHPDQAAQLMRDDSLYLKQRKIINQLYGIIQGMLDSNDVEAAKLALDELENG